MQAHLQRIEGKRAIDGDDQFAIQHKCLRRDGTQVFQHFREKARQRFAGLGLDLDVAARTKRKASKAVPLGLELPAGILWAAR